jgi:hypothetical protein
MLADQWCKRLLARTIGKSSDVAALFRHGPSGLASLIETNKAKMEA